MPQATGQIKKLSGKLNSPIDYILPIGAEEIALNELIGKQISLQYSHEISCIQCNKRTSKSFQQGYCYPCYRKLLDCNLCIIHPEKCNFPKMQCPDTWEHEHCKTPHVVYLANSSGLKIGITRQSQLPTRWIDQGASQAIPIFKVKNRYQSGLIEVLFKQYVADKTNWRKMLTHQIDQLDMLAAKETLLEEARQDLLKFYSQHTEIEPLNNDSLSLTYPILDYPNKLKALTFDKTPFVTGRLLGIKGQYLLFDEGVLNARKHGGYHVTLAW